MSTCTNVPLGTSVAATKEMCLYISVSAAPRRGAPHPSPLPVRGGQAHIRLGSKWGSPAATQGKLPVPGGVPPSTAQNEPRPEELAVGLISGVRVGRPRTLVQAGWRRGQARGSPPGSLN